MFKKLFFFKSNQKVGFEKTLDELLRLKRPFIARYNDNISSIEIIFNEQEKPLETPKKAKKQELEKK